MVIREFLQNDFRNDFRKGPPEILAGMVITISKTIMHVNTVYTENCAKFVWQNLPIERIFSPEGKGETQTFDVSAVHQLSFAQTLLIEF